MNTRILFTNINILKPYQGFSNYIIFIFMSVFFIILYTSLLYFSTYKFFKPPTDEENQKAVNNIISYKGLNFVICLYALISGFALYFFLNSLFHSLMIDPFGNIIKTNITPYPFELFTADILISIGVIGLVFSWFRFMQTLLIQDFSMRYKKMTQIIPFISYFFVLTFITGTWFFYASIFNFWWYMITFSLIYSLILISNYKDFRRSIKMHMSHSLEYEQYFSYSTISIIAAIIIIIGIVLPQIFLKTIPFSYAIILFIILWIVYMYMTPSKIFRHLKIFQKYSTPSGRFLNFVKYTRKYLVTWLIILSSIGLILGIRLFVDPGFQNPNKNLSQSNKNLKNIGESLEQYMIENKQNLPTSKEFKSGSWLKKIEYNKKISSVPICPSGGRYIYKKWRDINYRPIYEVCSPYNAHIRMKIKGAYPRYQRFKGLIRKKGEKGDLQKTKKSIDW